MKYTCPWMKTVNNMQKDPVCGMTVDEAKTKYRSNYEGRTFYFCSPSCRDTFDKDPHKYGHQS